MKVTPRVLFIMLLSLFLAVSCGSDNEDSEGTTSVPIDEEEADTDTDHSIRYTAVTIEENCGFWTDCDFSVRGDYNRRPVILTAHFVDNGWPGDEEVPEGGEPIDIGTCDFQVTLSEAEAGRLEGLADKLRICQVENTPTADGGFDGLFVTDRSGRDTMVYKHRDGGQEEEGKINYLCGGQRAYYSYLRKLIVPRAPADCPDAYQRLFR